MKLYRYIKFHTILLASWRFIVLQVNNRDTCVLHYESLLCSVELKRDPRSFEAKSSSWSTGSVIIEFRPARAININSSVQQCGLPSRRPVIFFLHRHRTTLLPNAIHTLLACRVARVRSKNGVPTISDNEYTSSIRESSTDGEYMNIHNVRMNGTFVEVRISV